METAVAAKPTALADIVVTGDKSNDRRRALVMIDQNDPREKYLGRALLHAVERNLEPGHYVVDQFGRNQEWYFTSVQQQPSFPSR